MVDASEASVRLGVRRATAQLHSLAMPAPYRLSRLVTDQENGAD